MAIENIKFKATIKTTTGNTLTKDGASLAVQDSSGTPIWSLEIYRDSENIPSQIIPINTFFTGIVSPLTLPTASKLTFKFISSVPFGTNTSVSNLLVNTNFPISPPVKLSNSVSYTVTTDYKNGNISFTINETSIGSAQIRFETKSLNIPLSLDTFRIIKDDGGYVLENYKAHVIRKANDRADWEFGPNTFYHGESYTFVIRTPYPLAAGSVVKLMCNLNSGGFKTITLNKATDVLEFPNMVTAVNPEYHVATDDKLNPWLSKNVSNAKWTLTVNNQYIHLDGKEFLETRAAGKDLNRGIREEGQALYVDLDAQGNGNRISYGNTLTKDLMQNTPFYYLKPNTEVEVTIVSGGGGGSASPSAPGLTWDMTKGYNYKARPGKGQRGGDGYIIVPVNVDGKFQLQLVNILTGGDAVFNDTSAGGKMVSGSVHPDFDPNTSEMAMDNLLSTQGYSATWNIDTYANARVGVRVKRLINGNPNLLKHIPGDSVYTLNTSDSAGRKSWGKGGTGTLPANASIWWDHIKNGNGGGSGALVTLVFEYFVNPYTLARGNFTEYPIYNPWFTGRTESDTPPTVEPEVISDAPGLAGGLRGKYEHHYMPTDGYPGLFDIKRTMKPRVRIFGRGSNGVKATLEIGKRYRITLIGGGGGSGGVLNTSDELYSQAIATPLYGGKGGDTTILINTGGRFKAHGGGGGEWCIRSPSNLKRVDAFSGAKGGAEGSGNTIPLYNEPVFYIGKNGYDQIGGESAFSSLTQRGTGGGITSLHSLPTGVKGSAGGGAGAVELLTNTLTSSHELTITVGEGGKSPIPNSSAFLGAQQAGFPGYDGVVIIEEL